MEVDKGELMNLMEKYRVERTCGACPEAYDVFMGDLSVGSLRLRHGCFTAEVGMVEVYEAYPSGDGIFEAEERDHYMHEAIRRIDDHIDPEGLSGALDPDEPVPRILGKDQDAPGL